MYQYTYKSDLLEIEELSSINLGYQSHLLFITLLKIVHLRGDRAENSEDDIKVWSK